MKSFFLMMSLMLLAALPAAAQDTIMSRILITELGPDVQILLDGEPVTDRERDTLHVSPGEHTIEQIAGSRFRWTVHRMIDTVILAPGSELTIKGLSASEHVITSQPDGAMVYRNGTLLGYTPFVFRHTDDVEGTISVARDGFETRTIVPSRSLEHVFLVRESEEPQVAGTLRTIDASLQHETWTIASAVAMVGSSIAAAYLKERANKSLAEYQRTGSQAALDDVRRYDNYSAVAAATMIVSFTGFAYLIELE